LCIFSRYVSSAVTGDYCVVIVGVIVKSRVIIIV
jgi:hypothetical protein